ncbi:MAG TPA: protein-L-isoaspartate(D-aspartate) O-methyltransferase [Pseudomonadales bacterium]|nr:protein-L-isoaspartate(D-aspartate) O-methyltransferase [Pseudomonadales bacterium]
MGGSGMREEMIRVIEDHMRDTSAEVGRHTLSPRVIEALRRVPREHFVPPAQARWAYRDSPLPIGHGQTISQPFIVALMTELLDTQPDDRVLEIGSGSGYQAAILAELVREVYGIEIVAELVQQAAQVLRELGYRNVTLKCGDGWHGWPEHAPFDGIMVTAAGAGVPDPLLRQLRIGGKLVLPVEDSTGWQNLDVIERTGEDTFHTRHTIAVRFVPLTGKH